MVGNNKIPKKTVCVSFRCTEDVYGVLNRASDLVGWTLSHLVSHIVTCWCEANLPDLVEFEKRDL